jgi:flagellar biosynthesis protein FlhF
LKVKRYEGKSEAALMPIILEEMGPNATIISVKEGKARGFLGLFGRPMVVVTAACEDDDEFLELMAQPEETTPAPPVAKRESLPELKPTEDIGQSMELLLQEARKAAQTMEKAVLKPEAPSPAANKEGEVGAEDSEVTEEVPGYAYNNTMVQHFYDTMLEQGVAPDVAHFILRNLENLAENDDTDIKKLVKVVYGSIIDILKDPYLIPTEVTEDGPRTIVFMGPTGVGKTTTIAKLSSILSLKHGLRVGLVTSDTYRIAAVEQLKTYADILGLTVRVVYSPEEIPGHLEALEKSCDIILVDTAGRSHKNKEGISELEALLNAAPNSVKYLVLSITTRYDDLSKIVSAYDQLADFSLIFTKLDETEALGTLMNLCTLAGKKASYVTFGQNVPDDIEPIKPDKVAKSLLGLIDGSPHPYDIEGVDNA